MTMAYVIFWVLAVAEKQGEIRVSVFSSGNSSELLLACVQVFDE